MEFFIRLFKPAPRDDTLLNMLSDNAVHMGIDNQGTQILRFTTRLKSRDAGVAAARRHGDFLQNTGALMPTWNILTRDLDETAEEAAYKRRVLNSVGLPVMTVAYDDKNCRVTPDSNTDTWIDSFNPVLVDQFVAFKNDDDAFSCLSRSGPELVARMKKHNAVLLSGFFAELCVARTAYGARHHGIGPVIVDPDQTYGLDHFAPVSRGAALSCLPLRGVTVTEPGQVAHVLGFGPR